jgi:LacI family transcriptional regulator
MSDVARQAGVHQTTVSLALRNDPRLPRETRARIREAADAMGYRPDPMLSALNFYRSSRDTAKAQPSIAFILRTRQGRPANAFFADEQFLRGARRACERMGYRIVVFQIGNTATEGVRLSRIIRSRGISGVILASLDTRLRMLPMEWDNFCALCIETQHLGLSLHTVGDNQSAVTRTAVRRAFELGYRRIGLAVGEVEEASLRKPFTAGYLIEVYENPALGRIPPLLLRPGDDSAMGSRLGAWVRRHRVDAILSNWSNMADLISSAGLRVPEDIGMATLDHNPRKGPIAGIRQSHELVGERAVESLAMLIKTNQRGLVRLPNITLVDGTWQDGPELPAKAPGAARRMGSRPRSKVAP